MLTSELVRVRCTGTTIAPRWLTPPERERAFVVVTRMQGLLAAHVGSSRQDVEQALFGLEHEPRDRLVVLGLKKLLFDRCDFTAPEGPDPQALREEVFGLASARRRELAPMGALDRALLLAEVAARHGTDAATIERRLFADLPKNELLESFEPWAPEALFERYDLALAQGVLLRATRVQITLLGERAGTVRGVFRAARFHGLLHQVERTSEGASTGYRIVLDGPMSLFSASQRYGLALALFFPRVLACHAWRPAADVLWGKQRRALSLELGPADGLVARGAAINGVAPELEAFVAGFRKLEAPWSVAHNEDIVALPGERAIIPDLLFVNQATGERVYLEAFGYWSRSAVWQRIETLRRASFPARILLAIGKHLRVSEEALDDESLGELYVYRERMLPKAVLARLEGAPRPLEASDRLAT